MCNKDFFLYFFHYQYKKSPEFFEKSNAEYIEILHVT